MKKSNIILTLVIPAMIFGNISCMTSSSEKLKNAETEAEEANENLSEAKEEYLNDMENFKKETDTKITANEQSIIEFKARIANSKKEAKAEYDKKISNLEQKNTDMKRKMDEYKLEGKDQWSTFKNEFSHDMDELSKALKDLTINNVK